MLSQLDKHKSDSVSSNKGSDEVEKDTHLEHHLQILEVGCSGAPLLLAVFPPPLYIYPSQEWRERGKKATKLANHMIFEPGPIAPQRVTIMDIDFDVLQEPINWLRREQNNSGSSDLSQRWYDLHVKILCASLDQDFTDKVGQVDVVVATEV